VRAFIVRKETKAHGTQKRIEGGLAPGTRVAIVEDVMTTGGSALEAIVEVEKAGAKVEKVYCLVDREEGGEELRKKYEVTSLFTIKDIRGT